MHELRISRRPRRYIEKNHENQEEEDTEEEGVGVRWKYEEKDRRWGDDITYDEMRV